jgi:hypothetical protein
MVGARPDAPSGDPAPAAASSPEPPASPAAVDPHPAPPPAVDPHPAPPAAADPPPAPPAAADPHSGPPPAVGPHPATPPAASPSTAADDERRARQEIEVVVDDARRQQARSNILPNVLFGLSLLVVTLLLIRVFGGGAKKEPSPFDGPPPSATAAPAGGAAPAAGAGPAFAGEVRLGEAVGPPPKGTLYVIVRSQGVDRGPPVAVKRIERPTFPARFTVSPADRMIKRMPFQGPFDVQARLDTDGDAQTKSPGDLVTSAPAPARPGQKEAAVLTLDERLE